jgi:TPR repeat protein
VADDDADPRQAMAAADLGAALAVGAHGLDRNAEEAERYLRIGIAGGDVSAQRNLGLMLLELGGDRLVEAMQELGAAAASGDEHSAGVLQQLQSESRAQGTRSPYDPQPRIATHRLVSLQRTRREQCWGGCE